MAEARKTVTVLFADVAGSTSLGESLDPEVVRRVMERFFDEARSAIERHGGTVEKFAGDAVMAVFGVPTVHEDDALRAVRAASEMRERLAVLNAELEGERGVVLALRTGVNTGEVVAGDPTGRDFYATGDAVNVAARLEQSAAPGGDPPRRGHLPSRPRFRTGRSSGTAHRQGQVVTGLRVPSGARRGGSRLRPRLRRSIPRSR